MQLVDERLARLQGERHEPIYVDGDHKQTCTLDEQSLARQRVINFIKHCLNGFYQFEDSTLGTDGHVSMEETEAPSISDQGSRSPRKSSIPGLKSMPKKRSDPCLPCFVMEPGVLVDDFIARDDILDAIDLAFFGTKDDANQTGTTISSYALCGLGGIGEFFLDRSCLLVANSGQANHRSPQDMSTHEDINMTQYSGCELMAEVSFETALRK